MNGAKDKLKETEEPGVVYALGCTECPSVYFGETARTAGQRAKEHKMHTRNGHIELSSVANHAHAAAHNVHWVPRVRNKRKERDKEKSQRSPCYIKQRRNRKDQK